MARSLCALFACLAAGSGLPAAASASDAPAGLKLETATGSLEIKESRCPAATPAACATTELKTTFRAAPDPQTRPIHGSGRFPRGVRVSGRGSGTCESTSPDQFITGPDGSSQFLPGATRVVPASSNSTDVLIRAGRRGIRWSWLEPLRPGAACTYFDEPGTALAIPKATRELMSRRVSPRELRRSRVVVTIAGTDAWRDLAADGSAASGTAKWSLRLSYGAGGSRTPRFVG